MKKPEIILRLLRIPFDFAVVFGSFLFAYWLRAHPDLIPLLQLHEPALLPWESFLLFSLQAAGLVLLLFAWEGMYSLRKSYRFKKEARRMLLLTGAAFTVIILYFFLVGIQFFSRFILGLAFVLTIVLMILHRLILRAIQRWCWGKGWGKRRVLFVGKGDVLKELRERWDKDVAFEVVDSLSTGAEVLERLRHSRAVDEVVQVGDVDQAALLVEFCQLHHIEYRFVPNMLEVQRINTELDFVGEIPLITLRSSAIDWSGRVVKRTFDVLTSSAGLLLLSPLLLLIACGIKLNSQGPVLYWSRRVSKNRQFSMVKFRTMVDGADQMKKDLEQDNRRTGPLFKIADDPRVTRFGRLLRKASLDELPQLWNVFKGDLSLVGPRAHLPEEVEQYERHHKRVLAIKAGVTGLPQISGRSHLDFEQEVKLDVYYIENWSFWLDMKIILKTFGVLFEGE
ncbi:MAG: sugar transferase [bacterium]|nr:sugar transferase [bacterium]